MEIPMSVRAIVLACRLDREWLVRQCESLPELAMAGGLLEDASTPVRLQALAQEIAAVRVPTLATDAEEYAVRVLALLASPKAALFTEVEIAGVLGELVTRGKAELMQWMVSAGEIIDAPDATVEELLALVQASAE